ncbi:MAG: GNAT family N-acetyltransferase [Lentisphaeria bacterium]|jgi:amino-acid N-acetyltransferase|nr:GNAT family N-acetyltransferase [Lentisphaeria bacterium]
MNESPIRIVAAAAEDAEAIVGLLQPYVPLGIVLPRSVEEIRQRHADFLVARDGGRIVGTVALRDFGAGLHEIRSLVVDVAHAGHGLGSRLVEAAVREAVANGAGRVFALTLRPHLFARLGFRQADMDLFPQKVWLDCAKCPKRDCCDEIALILEGEDLARFVREHRDS